jgi:hypothetical protein
MELLRHEVPDPFHFDAEIKNFYDSPVAQIMIANELDTINSILKYLGEKPEPALVSPVVLLLSYFEPQKFYDQLLAILKNAERRMVEGFEQGFWLIKKDQGKLASDLVELAPQNPNLLLLLQRPVVKAFKMDLRKFIESKTIPLALYAIYCYKYVLAKDDVSFLETVSKWKELPGIASEAKSYLQMINDPQKFY